MKFTTTEDDFVTYCRNHGVDPLLKVLTLAGKLLIEREDRGITINTDDFEMLITIKAKEKNNDS